MPERTIIVTREPGHERQPQASLLRLALAVIAAGPGLLLVGVHEPLVSQGVVIAAKALGLMALWVTYVLPFVRRADRRIWALRRSREITLLTSTTIALPFSWPLAAVLHLVLLAFLLTRFFVVLTRYLVRPGLLLIVTFLAFIAAGTLLLRLPAATPADNPITWLDALFTSTSAVCVTGLIVRDTATEFTFFGQVVVLILIQLGGLGIILFSAVFASMMGGSISLRHANNISQAVQNAEGGTGNIEQLVRFVVAATLLTEAVAAVFIYFSGAATPPELAGSGNGESHEIFISIFLSISAFCNAGFAPFTDSLVPLRYHWVSHLIIAPLIVIGGLGFVALYDLWRNLVAHGRHLITHRGRTRRRPRDPRTGHLMRLSLHTRIVLWTSLMLWLGGGAVILAGQIFSREASGTSFVQHLLDASFLSITCRTAGFNTMPMDELAPASVVMSMILMTIGGSPGSTAGGIKTVTIAVLVLTAWATLRGRPETEIMQRTISESLIRRAGVLAILGLLTISATAIALALSGTPAGTTELVFESISATSTVGLSLGVTPELSTTGRIAIIVSMFLGRVGPLALLGTLALGSTMLRSRYRYPAEPVMMG